PRAATRPPRRRAWLRIFVARCGLPCDPPVGGHSCNGGMIPRSHRAVSEKTALQKAAWGFEVSMAACCEGDIRQPYSTTSSAYCPIAAPSSRTFPRGRYRRGAEIRPCEPAVNRSCRYATSHSICEGVVDDTAIRRDR